MPHKHKRQRTGADAGFDLPPSSIAKPLSALSQRRMKGTHGLKQKPPKARKKTDDDTPKAFSRLIHFQTTGKRISSGLDDGRAESRKKQRKRNVELLNATTAVKGSAAVDLETHEIPQIMPGERLSDFAARVDQALPISGLLDSSKQTTAKLPGLKEKATKHNRRLERMQKEWREEERRRREKQEEELEGQEEEKENEENLWSSIPKTGRRNDKRKKSRSTTTGFVGADEEDPWALLNNSRADARQKGPLDVVGAPPQLKKPKSSLKLYGGAGVDVGNVPSSAGSLRKREELGKARRAVIEGYRSMMGEASA